MFGTTAFAQSSFAALGGSVFVANVLEIIQVLDAESGTSVFISGVNESVQASSAEIAQFNVVAAISETVQTFDTETALITTGLTIFEEARFSTLKNAQVDFVTAVSESTQVTDAKNSSVDFAVALNETVQCNDPLYELSLVLFVDLAETVLANEINASQAQFVSAVNEAFNALDVNASTANFMVALNEAAQVFQIDSSTAIFVVAVQEQIQSSDNLISRLLWELIGDSQFSSWGNINSDVNASWVLIDDNQVSVRNNEGTVTAFAGFSLGSASFAGGPSDIELVLGWLNASNAQNSGWGIIDDDQPSTWTKINTA